MQTNSSIDYKTLPRQKLTDLACDVLAAESRKPSVPLVREITLRLWDTKKGSDGDVQKDIQHWYEGLFELKKAAAIGGVPEHMATLFREVWRGAVDQAEEGLAAKRAQLASERAQAVLAVREAQAATDALRHQLDLATTEIDARDAAIARLDGAIVQREAQVVQLTARLVAKDERIESLSDELARKITEQAAAVSALEGDRRHALIQVDHARGEGRHWKEQFDRAAKEARASQTEADSYRNKASSLEAALAGANGRLSALQESLGAEKERTAALISQVAAEQQNIRQLSEDLSNSRISAEAANARYESAVRELSTARESVAEARSGERRALEEAAELRGRPASSMKNSGRDS
ncbi:hypothetical protein CR105_26655 [Massilia eurypsychrophila]|uniref:KfrA N-terminal DNA-binding domain-containing protein n=1 Tax=Massilia eurypsychrophila TaxID=1485217 RepID=A0A2G8T7H6_9BURK|nr:DNA-binding protein [Massilia eurypsychrophila]PIL41991.1 hypothetical protein CR105_26655 [Massilia eurypsychrophila]